MRPSLELEQRAREAWDEFMHAIGTVDEKWRFESYVHLRTSCIRIRMFEREHGIGMVWESLQGSQVAAGK